MEALMNFLTSGTSLAVFGLLAAYFAVKMIAVGAKFWTPRNRSLTLSAEDLDGWRVQETLLTLSAALFWAGLVLGGFFGARGYWLAVAAFIIFVVLKIVMMKRYPYIDPATVKTGSKKNGKKKK